MSNPEDYGPLMDKHDKDLDDWQKAKEDGGR